MVLLQIRDYRLTTAEILYHLPDHPALLQSYIWQNMDLAPQYPGLRKFLDFWESNLDGKLHSVRMATGPSLHTPVRTIRNPNVDPAIRQAKVRHATHYATMH